jgi:hypothetical protein
MLATMQLLSFSLIQSLKFVEHGGGRSPRAATLLGTTFEYANLTEDGMLEDSVLRMLVDKYKPLHTTATIQTAEEKMRHQ